MLHKKGAVAMVPMVTNNHSNPRVHGRIISIVLFALIQTKFKEHNCEVARF